jgi:hypothetical protein
VDEDVAQLGEHDVAGAPLEVLTPRANEAGDHRRAKYRLVGRERIRDPHSRHTGLQQIEVAITAEGRRPAFDGAEVDDHVAHVTA